MITLVSLLWHPYLGTWNNVNIHHIEFLGGSDELTNVIDFAYGKYSVNNGYLLSK